MKLGSTIVLWGCPAENSHGDEAVISGLFYVEEFFPYEPSNYVHSPFYVLVPVDADLDDPDSTTYSVDVHKFNEQVYPKAFGHELVLEREMMFAEEQRDMEDRFGNNRTIHDAGFRQ